MDSARVQEEGGKNQSPGFVEGGIQVGRIVTAGQLSLCSEEQSPQPGIIRPSPGVVVDGESSGLAGEGTDGEEMGEGDSREEVTEGRKEGGREGRKEGQGGRLRCHMD